MRILQKYSLVFILIILAASVFGGSLFSNLSVNFTNSKLLGIKNKIPTEAGKNVFLRQSNNLTKDVDSELVDLDSQIISCDPNVNNLSSSSSSIGGSCLGGQTTLSTTKGLNLGGQCCGALTNTKEYHEHLEALQKYKDIPDMVLNPYKTPINLAQKWIDYDKTTMLTSEEQAVYDMALSQSKEGPCCCKCWHYYVNKGIAKSLIRQEHYNSQQIEHFWGISDICGV